MLRFHIPSTGLYLSSQFIYGCVAPRGEEPRLSVTRVVPLAMVVVVVEHTYLCMTWKFKSGTEACTDILYFIISYHTEHNRIFTFFFPRGTGLYRQPYIFSCELYPRKRSSGSKLKFYRVHRAIQIFPEFAPIAGCLIPRKSRTAR